MLISLVNYTLHETALVTINWRYLAKYNLVQLKLGMSENNLKEHSQSDDYLHSMSQLMVT